MSPLKNKIEELDIVDDTFCLEESEVIERKEATADLFRSLNQQNDYSHKNDVLDDSKKTISIPTTFTEQSISTARRMRSLAWI